MIPAGEARRLVDTAMRLRSAAVVEVEEVPLDRMRQPPNYLVGQIPDGRWVYLRFSDDMRLRDIAAASTPEALGSSLDRARLPPEPPELLTIHGYAYVPGSASAAFGVAVGIWRRIDPPHDSLVVASRTRSAAVDRLDYSIIGRSHLPLARVWGAFGIHGGATLMLVTRAGPEAGAYRLLVYDWQPQPWPQQPSGRPAGPAESGNPPAV